MAEREAGRRLSYDLVPDVVLQWDGGEDDTFVVQVAFNLHLTMGAAHASDNGDDDASAEDGDPLANIKYVLEGLFRLEMREGDEAPTEEELAAYAETTGLFALYPFAREWAHDLTGRMGLPPLTLGVLYVPVDGPESSK
ncbi:SecB chaperone [Nostocoides sp. F2B08]|uniref:SecB chaperone n=1 Tax=Nostocoides sp. F2B08 TaxID=2653936 RepID=UPI0012639CAB|nr:SecB chaperone [Tetrasphaera sp. F2B08]KAB7739378.1 SecB chaperone [Tetrasphaera sp. F2B08]